MKGEIPMSNENEISSKVESTAPVAAVDNCSDDMPAGFYADMLAIEVGCTGAVSSTFHVDLDGEQWLVTAERVGCGRCGGAA